MIYLLDTQLILWAAEGSRRLPTATRSLLEDPKHDFLFSAAVIWEVTVKSALGRAVVE